MFESGVLQGGGTLAGFRGRPLKKLPAGRASALAIVWSEEYWITMCRLVAFALVVSFGSLIAGGAEELDEFMIRFIEEHKVPGAAIAVTKDKRLVYARGFGWADREGEVRVQPTSLFRIASLSKPVTAVAIMQLVQSGRLGLEDPMAKHLKGFAAYRGRKGYDPRLEKVTIRDLLQHSGGWDRSRSFDPMGLQGHLRVAKALEKTPPVVTRSVMKYMFQKPLQFDPGQDYAYSNFGYLLLGRIVEDTTGVTYEAYVRKNVLAPIGVTRMQIGFMEKELRAEGEVTYYDRAERRARAPYGRHQNQKVPSPYARPMQVMDAHGGWIASAVDLARFACDFDDPAESKLLKAETIATMFARPPGVLSQDKEGNPKDVYYALGWSVRPKGKGTANTWHTGLIQGTAALLVRRHDGFNWVLLFNTDSTSKGRALGSAADGVMHGAIDSVKSWPAGDLFKEFK